MESRWAGQASLGSHRVWWRRAVEAARRYVDGYRRAPETAAETRVATAAAMSALAAEPWDAEG